jgi:hypothetical protein
MYCPRCAVQNLDDAKFCRGCGTSLETVALALAGQYQPPANANGFSKDWLEIRHEGVQRLIRGIGLLGAALLIGVALGLFSDTNDWIIIWLVFVGWMAAWGVISLVSGIGSMAEAKFLQKRLEQSHGQYLGGRSKEFVTAGLPPAQPGMPLSVTEHTTRTLPKVNSEK